MRAPKSFHIYSLRNVQIIKKNQTKIHRHMSKINIIKTKQNKTKRFTCVPGMWGVGVLREVDR